MLPRLFWRDRSGNIAVVTALAMVPLITVIGAAIDYDRVSKAQSNLQQALDAATLASAATGKFDAGLAVATFNANHRQTDATVSELSFSAGTGTVVGAATVVVSTTFSGLMGIQSFTRKASSTAALRPIKLITATFRSISAQGAYSKDVFLFTKNASGAITGQTTVLTYRYSLNPSTRVGTKTITPAIGTTKTITVGPYETYGIGFVIYQDDTYYGKLVNPVTKYGTAADASTWIRFSGTCNTTSGQTANMEDGGDTNFLDIVYNMTCTMGPSASDKVRLVQ